MKAERIRSGWLGFRVRVRVRVRIRVRIRVRVRGRGRARVRVVYEDRARRAGRACA